MLCLAAALAGCTSPREYIKNGFKVGPNYGKPPAPVAQEWIDAADKRVRKDPDDLSKWWTVFNDPVLDQLICSAYRQNLTLREAGFRILQARAQLNIAVGNLFPQDQFARGDHTRNRISGETAAGKLANQRYFSQWDFGFNLAWELDFWGRFRRAVESSSASLDASVEDYDDVLVTLLSDVATNYVQLRTTELRIQYARKNVGLQQKTVAYLKDRIPVELNNGQLNWDQAKSVLAQTEAAIPELEITLRQASNRLCILMGIPPEELTRRLGSAPIPTAPTEAAVGIPADLLRRRPDVRRAERQAAAQSAVIGVAESELYPHIAINGTIGVSAAEFKDLFRARAVNGSFGPSFQWNILNYGRLANNVRLQDARFQELVAHYQYSVLAAQQEVENGLVAFLKAQERNKSLTESVGYARKAEGVVLAKFDTKTINIAQLIQIQQNLVLQEDSLAVSQGEIALGLIQVYQALGGGWQIRLQGCNAEAGLPQLGAPRTEPEPLPPPQPAGKMANEGS